MVCSSGGKAEGRKCWCGGAADVLRPIRPVRGIAVHLGRAKWAGTQPSDFGPTQKRPGTIYDGPG
jgi:hypothetical protein